MSARDMDAAFSLDTVAGLEALFARRQAAATAALADWPHRVVAYGDHPDQRMTLFLPEHPPAGGAPVQMFVHGGFWRSLDAALFAFLAPGFVPFGAALAVIDYPLMPAARMAEVVDACRRAAMFLNREAGALGCDPSRLFVSGNSAGGQIVAELMDRTWWREQGAPDGLIAGGTAISGIFDLEPVTRSFQDDSLGLTEEEIARFSPLRRRLDLDGPLIVAVGGDETGEFLRQSEAFAGHAAACGATVVHHVAPGTDHITVVLDALADPSSELNRLVRRQMAIG